MRQLLPPPPAGQVPDLAGLYAYPSGQWLRANMVASADGAATLGGVSAGLSSQADRDVFMLLRALADVVIVGAGTARAEGYGPARVREQWRGLRAGRPPTPPIAVITASCGLDPGSRLIAEAPPHARTIVITTAQAHAGRRAELEQHADVVVAGDETVDLKAAAGALADRGHRRMLTEGGPHLLAQLIEAGLLDELCLTIGPLMAGPGAPRVVAGALPAPEPLPLTLAHVLEDDSFLLCRYTRKDHLSRTARGAWTAAGSRDEQAKAKLCRFESEELAVAFGPPAADKVITETAHCPLLGLRPDSGPHRYPATYPIVQVCPGPAPVGLEEAVGAVPRNEHRFRAGSDRAGLLGQRRPAGEKVSDLRQVVASEPEPAMPSGVTGVEGEHHHAASHAPHLAQPGDRVPPVMNGADCHRGVEGLVLEREALRGGSHARRRACGALRPHDRRRFHRGDVAVRGLVGAGAGPDVQYSPRIAERSPDPCGDPRLGAPRHGVGGSDGVIQLLA
jgi:riboflavin biosynthesis pyrimidine reductase